MTDQMVLATQKWLNKTYRGKHGYNEISEDGYTGWNTVHALLRALQIELGISEPSDNFGTGTSTRYKADPIKIGPLENSHSNKYAILQGALWCKGYDTGHYGDLDDTYDASVEDAVEKVQRDAGISPNGAYVSVDLMKALLSMDQFVIVPGSSGDSHIRNFQQLLNHDYGAYFGIIPCDGIYDRKTNQAAIYMLQALESMPVGTANGNFGPSTKKYCPTIPYSGKELNYKNAAYSGSEISSFTYLLDVCLYVNGFGSGNFGYEDHAALVKRFQRHHALPVTGVVDLSTWLSLLVSCGDTGRRGTACDTRFEITAAHLATLSSHGYKYVGRYLTGGDFKQIRDGELDRIINGGLSVFPIFEEGGYKLSYFTAAQGTKDAATAAAAARRLRIPPNSVIYFAVDFDALDSDVTSNILPYFHALHTAMKDYRIGVYGPRNVCLRTGSSGYSVSSFVADMSSGFSGNMGYRLPDDWAFDQISNTVLKHGSDSVEIDNNIASGLAASCSVNRLSTSLDMKPTPTVPPDSSTEKFSAYVNRSLTAIPIYDYQDEAGNIIGHIQPNEAYIRRIVPNSINQAGYELYSSDGNGGAIHGWYSENPVLGSDIKREWAANQEAFTDWNVEGNILVRSANHAVPPIDDTTKYKVFTLRHDANWTTTVSGEPRIIGVLPAGAQIAAISATMGTKWPMYMNACYWGSGNVWMNFRYNGSVISNAFVDFGLQYGGMPENRLLQ